MTCPRCERQKYDRGSCSLCGNLGWLCPGCGGRMTRTPVYSGGRVVRRCEECAALVVDDNEEPVSDGKLIPIRARGDERG